MDSMKKIFKLIVLELMLFEVIYCQHSVGISLYDENDSVIVLNADNFGHYIYDQNAFTLVNFYIHWCGHCVAFSPIWKQFANNIKNWESIVRVAAINCADEQNNDLCQRDKTNSFPRVRIFPMNAQSSDLGQTFEFQNQSVVSIRTALVDFLLKSQKTFSNRLNLFPMSVASKAQLFNVLPINLGKHNLIFLERQPTNLGVEVIMDFSSHTENIVITRVHDRTGSLTKDIFRHFVSLPALIQIDPNRKIQFLASANSKDEESLRHEFGVIIRNLLPAEIRETQVITDTDNTIGSPGMKDVVVVPKEALPLSMTDLYNTLRYSLYNEVDRYSVLNETQLVALKEYFSIIYKYFPFDNENVRRFFKRMNHWFLNKSKELKVVDLKAAMKISDGYLEPILDWKHCNGSKPQFRGYPCGLWSLFHVLTVNEYIQSQNNSHEVLHAMRNFIINFFSCQSCAENFAQASVDLDSHLVARESSVLWLWRVHNQVNHRLKGTQSEDPFYPKVQFPTQLICPDCYKSNSEFDDQNVLKFLTQYYNKTTLTKNGIQILNPSKIVLSFYLIICYSLYIFSTR